MALSVMVTVPVRVPPAVGVKVTFSAQVALGASVAGSVPQLLASAKSPLIESAVIVRLLVPVLVSFTDCAALVVPTT